MPGQPACLHVSPYRTCRTCRTCRTYLLYGSVSSVPTLCTAKTSDRCPLSMSNVHPAELTLIGIQCVDARPGSTLIVDSPSLSMGKSNANPPNAL
jgi:hypothetical protein